MRLQRRSQGSCSTYSVSSERVPGDASTVLERQVGKGLCVQSLLLSLMSLCGGRQISGREYLELVSQAPADMPTIHIKERCFAYNNRYYVLR